MFWRSLFDVRRGEGRRLTLMTLYLALVLFAYYILKPVSRAIFLSALDIDKLPWLYILIASVGGVFAYFYTKLAVLVSLRRAVDFATLLSIGILIFFWATVGSKHVWVIYAFNIWVSLFSIILVAQGWFVAANTFNTREAKRLYGILGVGSVIGAAFGGSFTAATVRLIGTNNLILASAGMVVLSYIPFYLLLRENPISLASARGAENEGEEFSFREILAGIRRHRHLQVIIGIMMITFIIDVMVEFQFNAQAKIAYHNHKDALTAFLGNFYGLWLNLITFVLQFFVTSFVVSRFGVGGTLQIMPLTITAASLGALLAPGLMSTAATRLAEASTRYSFNKTGTELLYLPLPLELRNRTKAFVDIFVDRMSRGIGGMILVFFTTIVVLPLRMIALVVMCFAVTWVFLSIVAKHEYVRTVRRRLELRRLDLASVRVSVDDRATVALLEQTARSGNPRQAAYAISLLGAVRGQNLKPLFRELASSPSPDVRARLYEAAIAARDDELLENAMAEIRSARAGAASPAISTAVPYALEFDSDTLALARRLLDHPSAAVAEAAVRWLASQRYIADQLLTREWLMEAARSENPARRRLAAEAVAARGDEGTEALFDLLHDRDPETAAAAFRAAGQTRNREYVSAIVDGLANPRLRGPAIEALVQFGARISGFLGDLLQDDSVPRAVRLQIPRALRLIPDQRSVNALLPLVYGPDPAMRASALRALNRLRENAPNLNYNDTASLTNEITAEARRYLEFAVCMESFRDRAQPHTAAALLVSTLRERTDRCLERVFRLLGLRYPPRQIYAAWLAVHRRKADDLAAALEFLDNTLDRDLKRILVPLLDAGDSTVLLRHARDLFGVEPRPVEEILRTLMAEGDEWLASCSIATAAELGLRQLTPQIEEAMAGGDENVSAVARDAVAALA